ncbi:MAG: hypothetical protein K2Q06_16350 [Parvularculaceae bacterium]|nr:hypothetical protein [Parvularculaceae bacterium]
MMLLLAALGALSAEPELKVANDRKYGACDGAVILADFVRRYPPKTKRFLLEIDVNRDKNIFVYYRDQPAYRNLIALYDSKTCIYLRTEERAPRADER